ncbi:MAG: hypothetical protein ACOX0C_02155 [Patescibacteria group bacterium]|jgi:hypothetical protein
MKIATATNKPIDANKLKLVEYLALPKACRPMPIKRFAAEVLGVSEPTVHAWKKTAEVVLSVRKTIEQKFADDIPDVLLALRDNALAGNPRAAKIFLEYVESGVQDVDMPREELSRKEVEAEIDRLKKKFYPSN